MAIYPLNGVAILQDSLNEIAAGNPEAVRLDAKIKSAMPAHAGDSRFYSLLGMLAGRRGDSAESFRLFAAALKLSKAEQYAASQMLMVQTRRGDFAGALENVGVLLNRWPDRLDDVFDAMRVILRDPAGRQVLTRRMGEATPWRRAFLLRLAGKAATLPEASQLLMELRDAPEPPGVGEVNAAMDGFIRFGDAGSAFRLFVFTLTDAERAAAGNVFNGQFKLPPSGKVFDWAVAPHVKGLVVTMPFEDAGARLEFQDRPVTDNLIQQTRIWFPGRYNIRVVASARALAAPRPLYVFVRCGAGNEAIRLEIPVSTYNRRPLSGQFEIPEKGCETQNIGVSSSLSNAASWNSSYSGALILHSVDVERPSL